MRTTRVPPETVRIQGAGPTVVLVHGTGGSRSAFGTLPWHLRDRLRVVSYDRRGTGAWPLPVDAEAPTVERHASDLADVVRSLGDEPVVVFGTSFGATIALEALRSRRNGLAGAILHEPAMPAAGVPGAGPPPVVGSEFLRLTASGREREAAERFLLRLGTAGEAGPGEGSVARRPGAPDWRAVHRDLVAAFAWRPGPEAFGAVDVPVLLLASERSGSATRASVDALARLLPRARTDSLAGAAHVIAGEPAWRRVAEIVLPFALACAAR